MLGFGHPPKKQRVLPCCCAGILQPPADEGLLIFDSAHGTALLRHKAAMCSTWLWSITNPPAMPTS